MLRIDVQLTAVVLLLVGVAAASGRSWPPPPPYSEKAKMGNRNCTDNRCNLSKELKQTSSLSSVFESSIESSSHFYARI